MAANRSARWEAVAKAQASGELDKAREAIGLPNSIRLYHVTTAETAAEIERQGFRDGNDLQGPWRHVGDSAPRGVWLSYTPLDVGDLPRGVAYDACLAIEVPRSLANEHQWAVPLGSAQPVEVWCIPAATLNTLDPPERLSVDWGES